ncbi:methyltransferase domain-containing protein [Uliginosibacterium sp. sgz301328]|uniref:methyltransferase domain-containing protein n=1 Tax=Uliginosibacterium sp. sgz301328 TaxID=3243764 RepID=UPI00359ED436
MAFIDKSGALSSLGRGERNALELGCGARKRHANAIGVDALDYPGVDLVGDVFAVLEAIPAGTVRTVHAYHFFEHVDDLPRLLSELARVMAPGALLDVEVPHFANPYFYSDPTHAKFFGLYTFSYLARETLFRRKVPQYGLEPAFELRDVRLQFDSPFPFRGLFKRAVGPIFNVTRWLQEFHEENLCYLFPCYQLRFELIRL